MLPYAEIRAAAKLRADAAKDKIAMLKAKAEAKDEDRRKAFLEALAKAEANTIARRQDKSKFKPKPKESKFKPKPKEEGAAPAPKKPRLKTAAEMAAAPKKLRLKTASEMAAAPKKEVKAEVVVDDDTPGICPAVIIHGPRRGKQCGNPSKGRSLFCGVHKGLASELQ
jgi:hypothetical protein